jgi:tRNA(fMet)-specific endonuclease VapC
MLTGRDGEPSQTNCVVTLLCIPSRWPLLRLQAVLRGQQAARGVSIAFEDLIIGATALHLGFDVVTLNIRHFQAIPRLGVVTF